MFSQSILDHKYAMTSQEREKLSLDPIQGERETWEEIGERVGHEVAGPYLSHEEVKEIVRYIKERKFIPGGRYLYASGRKFHQINNCLLLDVEDSREGWSNLARRTTSALMTGAGIGVVYSKLREKGAHIGGLGGKSTGPVSLMNMINEIGRNVMQGGSRRSAIWAGLHWNHPDVFEFIHAKDWSEVVREQKEQDFNFPAPLDMTNISVILDDDFFEALEGDAWPEDVAWAQEVWERVTHRMCKTGEPGFSIDVGENSGEHLRNACTEVVSSDDNEVCNLGSVNLSKIENVAELSRVTELATAFLLCGTLYSDLPYDEVYETRSKNRRLGLGLMGLHEWLMQRGYSYQPNQQLQNWLGVWKDVSNSAAKTYAEKLGVKNPVKIRAIAPTGTIAIIGETTAGIEPVFCAAYKRRYLKDTTWYSQYVVDYAVRRMLDNGIPSENIEDAYNISVDQRIEFQAFVQQFVDNAISSTINMSEWGSESNNPDTINDFRKSLRSYLPYLRGITVYPDGGRGGQPISKVDLETALSHEGVEFEELSNTQSCRQGVCGV